MDLVSILILVALLLTAIGSFFPQSSPTLLTDPQRLARWESDLQSRFGTGSYLLANLGAFNFFHSPLFITVLGLLGSSTLICTLERWKPIWRRSFRREVRFVEHVFDSAEPSATLSSLNRVSPQELANLLYIQGFHVFMEEEAELVHLRAERNRLSPLGTLVTHLGVVLLFCGILLSNIYSWRETVVVGPENPAEAQHIRGLYLDYQGFTIERYPDGSAASYEARLQIERAGQEVARGSAQVNDPLVYQHVGLFLQGFEATAQGYRLTLMLVYDPGYPLVLVAGFLFLLGIVVRLNFPRCVIYARIKVDGSIRLAGLSDRYAFDFAGQFQRLVEQLQQAKKKGSLI
jgi:cytochrome c biogenesis protein